MPIPSLLQIDVPISVLETEEAVLVSGFASTGVRDRSGDISPATEFDLAQFLATSGQLLLDHDFIRTPEGNSVSAGNVRSAVASFISRENPSNPDQWIVTSISTGEFVAVWDKSLAPNMDIGDDGVFVIAEVTNDFAINLVLEGRVSSFSWQGIVNQQECDRLGCVLRAIDLIEISLVHMPANPTATFRIVDQEDPEINFEVSLKDCGVYAARFDKTKHTLDQVKRYTKSLNLDKYTLSDNEDNIFLTFGEDHLVDKAKAFSFVKGDKEIFVAPKIEKTISEVPIVGAINANPIEEKAMSETQEAQKSDPVIQLFLADFDTLQKVKGANVTFQKNVMLENGLEAEVHAVSFETSEPCDACESKTTEAPIEEAQVASTPAVVTPAATIATEPVAQVATEATETASTETVEEGSDKLDKVIELLSASALEIKELSAKVETLESNIEDKDKQVAETLQKFVTKEKVSAQNTKLDQIAQLLGTATPREQPQPEVVAKSFAGQDEVVDPLQSIFV